MKISGAAKKDDSKLAEYVHRGKEEAHERLAAAQESSVEFIDARANDVGQALDRVSAALRGASETIEHAGEHLGERGENAAARVDRASKYLAKNDPGVFVQDLQDLSQRHMGWAVGIAFAAGIAVARLSQR